MAKSGKLTRNHWLAQSFPDGEPVSRGVYEAVMMALVETGYCVDRKQPKPGRLTTGDAGLILNALAERYPDGMVVRESIGYGQ